MITIRAAHSIARSAAVASSAIRSIPRLAAGAFGTPNSGAASGGRRAGPLTRAAFGVALALAAGTTSPIVRAQTLGPEVGHASAVGALVRPNQPDIRLGRISESVWQVAGLADPGAFGWFANPCVLIGVCPAHGDTADFRVLTLNIQIDAVDGRLPGIAELIRRSRADVVALQEVNEAGPEIARQLGMHYVKTGVDTAVLSRFELIPPDPGKLAVTVLLEGGAKAAIMNLHLGHAPYQPFQLLHIPYEGGRFIDSEAEAIDEAHRARGRETGIAVREAKGAPEDLPFIIVGDFNQPSHLDWTEAAARAKRHPIKVAWPESSAFAAAGFADSYRSIYPDEIAHPGFTWAPTISPADTEDHPDRLDFILHRGPLEVRSAELVGGSPEISDIVIAPYPTDHLGVVVQFRLAKRSAF